MRGLHGEGADLDAAHHEQGKEDEDGCGSSHDVGNNQPCLPV